MTLLIHAGSKKISLTYSEIENLRVETSHDASDSIMKVKKITFSREDQCGSFQTGILVIDLDELSIIFHSSNVESNKLDICAQNSWTTTGFCLKRLPPKMFFLNCHLKCSITKHL